MTESMMTDEGLLADIEMDDSMMSTDTTDSFFR